MSVVDKQSLIIGLINELAAEQQNALFREMKRLGARTLGLQDEGGEAGGVAPDQKVSFQSGIPEIWQAPLYLPVLQLIAYERAMHRDLDPDRPVNLESVVVLNEHLL